METWSFVMSVAALLFSGFTFFFYDHKLKRQDTKINEYQLKQWETEEKDSKKAQIRGNIFEGPKGSRIMKIYNSGRAIARNIRVDGLNVKSIIVQDKGLFPYELMNPKDYTELKIFLFEGGASKLTIKFIWDDDSGKDNEFEQVLTL